VKTSPLNYRSYSTVSPKTTSYKTSFGHGEIDVREPMNGWVTCRLIPDPGGLSQTGPDAMALLMPRPLLLSSSICLMDDGGLDRGPWLLPTIHTLCHTHWMCCNSVTLHSGHMTFIVLSILERDPPLLLSWRVLPFSPREGLFGSCSWSHVRSKVRDVYVYWL